MASHQGAATFFSKKSTMGGMVAIGLVAALAGGYFWWPSRPSPPPPYTGPVEKLSLGITTIMSTLLWVADQNGYFQAQGLDVTIQMYDAGLFAVNGLLAGKVQVAACSEFVLATQILAGRENLRALGTIASSRSNKTIARRDRGIAKPEDLAGKRIGVTRQTTGDYFLDLFLTLHALAVEQVQLVNMKPLELSEALSRGQWTRSLPGGPLFILLKSRWGSRW
jgi:NitT/TauT family transport system substrate-binding protein